VVPLLVERLWKGSRSAKVDVDVDLERTHA
jgi:hypothetical protein